VTTQATLTPSAFAAKWRSVATTEKASSHSHFIDICRMLGEPTPHESDPTGEHYAFEKRVTKAGGGDGYADVWKRDFFAWVALGEITATNLASEGSTADAVSAIWHGTVRETMSAQPIT
jgi:hypothetical protein